MKKIILIQAYKDLDSLNDLIDQLQHKDLIIYVHLDKKSTIDISRVHNNAIIVRKRVDVGWGEFSQVKATLNGLKQIFIEQTDFSHVILISGQDYPLQSPENISSFLDRNLKNNFIQYFEIPDTGKYSNFKWRYNHYHFSRNELLFRKFYSLLIHLRIINKYNRSTLKNYKYYWGSQWWMLTKEALEDILSNSSKNILKYFSHVFCSDEMFFQMLLLNSKNKFDIINDHKKFMIWEEFDHPKNLTISDFKQVDFENYLFCRKIESGISDSLKSKIKSKIND